MNRADGQGAAPWRLVSFESNGAPGVGIQLADGAVARADGLVDGADLGSLFVDWEQAAGRLQGLEIDGLEPVADARLLTPLASPGKVICCGANYFKHLLEMGIEELPSRDSPPQPFFFLKPRTSIIGPDQPILLTGTWAEAGVDWEAELGVVIGKKARRIDPDRALEHIAGYTIVNDVTARQHLQRPDAIAPPFAFDWFSSKGPDTFCPVGPGVVPAWFVDDPGDLRIRLWVNDEIKQDSSSSDMIVPIAEQIAAVSEVMTLEPGDLLATGTPAGVGKPRGESLSPGDEVRVEIEHVGVLSNPVEEG